MDEQLLGYYAGDEFSAGVWRGKYALKNQQKQVIETTPMNMHRRMAKELARIDAHLFKVEQGPNLSKFGQELRDKLAILEEEELKSGKQDGRDAFEEWIFQYLDRYKYIIPQGSIMSMLGNPYAVGSLSNCFVVPAPLDSYGGIFKTDQEIAQLEKRRGGVGTNLNSLRPDDTPVQNAAGSSTGAHSFMDRYSNTTREVAQNGRRGALMLLMSVQHPDIFKFVTKKSDLTKVTGANVSCQLTDDFMKAVEEDADFMCRFPIDIDDVVLPSFASLEYNKLTKINFVKWDGYVMKIKAKELFDLIVEMAWTNGEPGIAFMDNIVNWSPEGVYKELQAIASNPCGEQWMQAYDACRLLCLNLFSLVKNPWKENAEIDYEKLYEVAYIQQRLADDIVELEIEYVDRIIAKIQADPEPEDVKATELLLWQNIRKVASGSRRTGCGFTGMADMLAALGLKYDSDEAIAVIGKVMKEKMRGELDCTIDLAILRGTFEGWNVDAEFAYSSETMGFALKPYVGRNPFYQMLLDEFPDQARRMIKYGRRNVNWSTVAPTGTVSIVALLVKYANMSAGIEPVFFPWYFRNKKVNPSDAGARVDFTDQNGDTWMTYPVVMGGFKEWYEESGMEEDRNKHLEDMDKDELQWVFEQSPYYQSTANDISWEKRIEIQALVQKYTTNAISSTLNLPSDVSKEVVAGIYKAAWKRGLKGVTVYRDGCRSGVMNKEEVKKEAGFMHKDAAKRPKEIESELHITSVKGVKYGVVIGFVDKHPYEIFAFNLPDDIKKDCTGITTKVKKGVYKFTCPDGIINNLQDAAIHKDEIVLTRLVSGMLRHGVAPQYVMEQIEKCELEIVSFGKAVSRILKKYVKEEDLIKRNTCKSCGSTNLRMQEGCLACMDCGNSKCG